MRVAILGCGYLGLALCRHLLAAGHDVTGVRRSESGCAAITKTGARALRADVTIPAEVASVPAVDAVVFAASAGGGAEAATRTLLRGIETALSEFGSRSSPPDRFIYTSSTGVYGDHDGAWVDEETPLDPAGAKGRVLVEAERLARASATAHEIDPIVARLSGIYGPARYRIDRYLDGPVTPGYRNSIHRDDAAGAIAHVLSLDRPGPEVVLVTDDEPVDRWTFADWLADRVGAPPPPKRSIDDVRAAEDLSPRVKRRLMASKRCSNARLRGLAYVFRYPTFREGYREAITQYRSAAS